MENTKDNPIYYFKIDEKGLEFEELGRSKGLPSRLTLIAPIQQSDISYKKSELDQNGNVGHLEIIAGGKKFVHKGKSISGIRVSTKNRALYFWQLSADRTGGEIWQWNEKNGFLILARRPGIFMEFCLTPDDLILCANEYDPSRNESHRLLTISIPDAKVTEAPTGLGDRLCAILDKNRALVSSHHSGLIFKTEYDLYLVNLSTGDRTRFLADEGAFNAATMNGAVWCLCEKGGVYSAIRLNATYDKVEERIDLSKYVNRPWTTNPIPTASN